MSTPQTPAQIISNARAVVAVLENAERVGLPMPHTAHVSEHDKDSAGTLLIFPSLVELTEWSRWAETPITEHPVGENIHHTVDAVELDYPIHCVAITRGGAS